MLRTQILNKVVTVFAALCSEIEEHATKVSYNVLSVYLHVPGIRCVSAVTYDVLLLLHAL